jgi:hypothetical protein
MIGLSLDNEKSGFPDSETQNSRWSLVAGR